MQGFINVHCHLLNFNFVPDSFVEARAPVREWMLRHRLIGWLAGGARLLPLTRYERIDEALAIMRKDIDDVAIDLVSEMKEANIALSVPLMMDLEIASFGEKPECPYRYQVQLVSDIAGRYPGKIMPFVMFDPRRRSVWDLTRMALEEMGFLGVKMYPPLGYHPDPTSMLNEAEVNRELENLYEYCERESVPVTTHCSRGGAYSNELIRCRKLARDYCQPSSWRGVLERHPKLYLNFAHFGGVEDFMKIWDGRADSWSRDILGLMEHDNVYADISSHYHGALDEGRTYFQVLRRLVEDSRAADRIVFGTDWPMSRHTWKDKAYVKSLEQELAPAVLQRIAFENPLNFLFPGRKMPLRIKRFLESRGASEADFPDWMRDNLDI